MKTEPHPLSRYFTASGVKPADLVRRTGGVVSEQRISDVLAGRVRRFSPEAAEAIELATNGAVTFKDLLLCRRRQPRRSKRS